MDTLKKAEELQLDGLQEKQVSSYLISREQMEDLGEKKNPLTIVGKDGKYRVALGIAIISEIFDTKEEAINDAKRTDVQRMCEIADAVYSINKKLEGNV